MRDATNSFGMTMACMAGAVGASVLANTLYLVISRMLLDSYGWIDWVGLFASAAVAIPVLWLSPVLLRYRLVLIAAIVPAMSFVLFYYMMWFLLGIWGV